MIHFVCICQEPFDVPAEMAGEQFQCPACGRLVDVPLLGQADSFNDDGTVRMGEAPHIKSDLASKFRAFGGGDDLRNSLDEFLIAGTGDPLTTPRPRPTPKYDPITGELMLPVEIMDDELPPPPVVETGMPVLGYAKSTVAQSQAEKATIGWWTMPIRLLMGTSLIAIGILWSVHAAIVIGVMIPGFNLFFILPAIILMVVIAAHYANTIEDFGPNDRDSVPVLLRGVSFSEDVFRPMGNILLSALYSFFPLLTILLFGPQLLQAVPALGFAGVAWGMLLFPAVLFTLVCGGVWQNLAPKRVISVMSVAPTKYVIATLTFWVASATYLVALGGVQIAPLSTISMPSSVRPQFLKIITDTSITLGIFAVAVYLMHLAASWLGLIHRIHADDLNWVLQRHERVGRTDVMAQLRDMREGRTNPAKQKAKLQNVTSADAVRTGGAAQPVLPIETPKNRRHSGFEVKLKR